MSEWEEAKERAENLRLSPMMGGLVDAIIQAADAEITRLNKLLTNSEAGKFIETQRNEITRLKELMLRQTNLNTEVIKDRDRLKEELNALKAQTEKLSEVTPVISGYMASGDHITICSVLYKGKRFDLTLNDNKQG